jgi:F0F1-type ATP synthase beta subunit
MMHQNVTGLRICFTGGRHYNDITRVTKTLQKLKPIHVIVGCALGLDELVRKSCKELNIPLTVFTADWQHS